MHNVQSIEMHAVSALNNPRKKDSLDVSGIESMMPYSFKLFSFGLVL